MGDDHISDDHISDDHISDDQISDGHAILSSDVGIRDGEPSAEWLRGGEPIRDGAATRWRAE